MQESLTYFNGVESSHLYENEKTEDDKTVWVSFETYRFLLYFVQITFSL